MLGGWEDWAPQSSLFTFTYGNKAVFNSIIYRRETEKNREETKDRGKIGEKLKKKAKTEAK